MTILSEIPLPADRLGTRRSLTVARFGTPGARPKAYIQAALHADEIPGLLVAHHLLRRLESAEVTGEIVLVPMANPVGLSQVVEGYHVGRYALDGDGNFNRAFPDLTDAAEERLRGRLGPDAGANAALVRDALHDAHAAIDAGGLGEVAALRHTLVGLALDADLVLDLHCDAEAVMHLYTGDPLWPEVSAAAAQLGCRIALLSMDSGGTPFDEACSAPWWKLAERLGAEGPIPPACVAATIELRGKADVSDDLAAADADAILRVLMRKGIVKGDPGPLPAPACEPSPLSGLDRLTAPVSGVVSFHRAPGDLVRAGDLVAEIVDPTAPPATARTELRARTDGMVMARMNTRFAGRGDLVASVAGATPLAQARGLLFD